jgi:hypothetical protein
MNSIQVKTKSPRRLLLAAFTLTLTIGLAPQVSHAVQCIVDSAGTSLDGYVDSSSLCGVGNSTNNIGNPATLANTITYLEAAIPGTGTVTLIDTINIGDQGVPGTSSFFKTSGGSTGTWQIDTANLSQYEGFIIILKDGEIPPPPENVSWEWFLLDGTSSIVCDTGYEICGSYGMWANNQLNSRVNLSHMTLYGLDNGDTSTTATQVPEPSAMFLVGSGLLMLARAARGKRD